MNANFQINAIAFIPLIVITQPQKQNYRCKSRVQSINISKKIKRKECSGQWLSVKSFRRSYIFISLNFASSIELWNKTNRHRLLYTYFFPTYRARFPIRHFFNDFYRFLIQHIIPTTASDFYICN